MKVPHWSAEEIAYFDAMVADGPIATHIIISRMTRRFDRLFIRASVYRRLRMAGIPCQRPYSDDVKTAFAAFIERNPGLTSYRAAKIFNAETGADISGQLANYWRTKEVA